MQRPSVAIVGAGFAGSEAAWQLARRGIAVRLFEMRPGRRSEAHQGGDFAELVCSNSFKSERLENAHGLLKAELAAQGSLILEGAQACRVPAGQALAVDRELFAAWITRALEAHPLVEIRREEVEALEPLRSAHARVIVATGPLTSQALAADIGRYVGGGFLYFYDAVAPVIATESIDLEVIYRASRYGKGGDDYLNCPMNREQYLTFVAEIGRAATVAFHDFESLRHFEGCLPIEVMAGRGEMTLAFGPMKPVGLAHPRSGERPFAVVQLRQENRQASLYSMVGFQTKMTWPEQRRIFRTIPGLERAEFARLGSLHRNTFLESPRLLDGDLALREAPWLHFAGQITGVEGYIESCATGMYAAKRAACLMTGGAAPPPGGATMTGALVGHVTGAQRGEFQPMNAAFGLLSPAPPTVGKKARKAFYARRAMEEIEALEAAEGLAPSPPRAGLAAP